MIAINKGLGNNEQNWNYGILLKLPIKEFQEIFLNKNYNENEKVIENINKKNDYINNKTNIIDEITIVYRKNPKSKSDLEKFYNFFIFKNFKEKLSKDKIFGETFVENNRNKCKIIFNGKEYRLCSDL